MCAILILSIRISIHAPRVGSDLFEAYIIVAVTNFNPRSPCGERRGCLAYLLAHGRISIHAPRVGSDADTIKQADRIIRFQSTLPVWGATTMAAHPFTSFLFQSTLPVWGATKPRPMC